MEGFDYDFIVIEIYAIVLCEDSEKCVLENAELLLNYLMKNIFYWEQNYNN